MAATHKASDVKAKATIAEEIKNLELVMDVLKQFKQESEASTQVPAVPAQVAPAVPVQVAPAVPAQVAPAVPAQVAPAVPAQVAPAVPAQVVPVASAQPVPVQTEKASLETAKKLASDLAALRPPKDGKKGGKNVDRFGVTTATANEYTGELTSHGKRQDNGKYTIMKNYWPTVTKLKNEMCFANMCEKLGYEGDEEKETFWNQLKDEKLVIGEYSKRDKNTTGEQQ